MNTAAPLRKIRCAVYTRKSSEEGLEQEFNSLDAQREACEAYVTSQRHEGWVIVPDLYDDGGISGGTLKRPALQRLLRDIEAGLVDIVVVYKVDRLSRSLTDFAKLVDAFEASGVTFVSVTQQFNTTTSMGRLTLNMLLSFAQFEREVIGERIRDKFAASRRKGMWMGGIPPLGYDVKDRKLVVNAPEADLVRKIFERFAVLGSATALVKELRDEGARTKSWTTQDGRRREGKPVDKGKIYKILRNRVYLGEAVHKGDCHPGEHDAIVSQAQWDRAHEVLKQSPRKRANNSRARTPAPLKGLLRCSSCAASMSPSHTRRRGRLYRYYVCQHGIKNGADACPVRSIAAAEIEGAVFEHVRRLIQSPEIAARTVAACHALDDGGTAALREREVHEALGRLDEVWEELFPAEQARILRLLVDGVDVAPNGVDLRLRLGGIHSLVAEMAADGEEDATRGDDESDEGIAA